VVPVPKNVFDFGNFKLYSLKWGDARRSPLPFDDKWQRFIAAAKKAKLSRDARRRLEWIIWYETLGERNARVTCRHFSIAPKVFYFWKRRFLPENLALLESRSRRPHRVRQRGISPEAEVRIAELRKTYLHYSKIKLAIIYRERYGQSISSWQIQKVIQRYKLYPNPKRAENTAKKRRKAVAKKRITELVKKPQAGFLFSLDSIICHWEQKRYIITAIDRFSKLAYARMYTTHSSVSAADFLQRLHQLVGGDLVNVHTDNGSEFKKYFEQAIRDLKLDHWWSRNHTPKDNAVCERFNRTLKEEFIGRGNAHVDHIVFNRKLTEWLVEYDFHRPHAALGYKRPIEVACKDGKALPMYSSHTCSCAFSRLWYRDSPIPSHRSFPQPFIHPDALKVAVLPCPPLRFQASAIPALLGGSAVGRP
jgi:transposase InsO family protein